MALHSVIRLNTKRIEGAFQSKVGDGLTLMPSCESAEYLTTQLCRSNTFLITYVIRVLCKGLIVTVTSYYFFE